MKHGKLWVRLLAAVCVLALILPTISTAFAASYPYETISMDDVNMRSRASTSSLVIKKIKAGDIVTVLGSSGNFYRVKFDGKTGYAMKAFIDGTDPSADAPFDESRAMQAPSGIYAYPYDTLVLQNVKLRKTAEVEGEVIRMLKVDTLVEVLDRTANGFAKVKVDGKTGYVVETHINLANIPVPTAQPTATPVPGSDRYQTLSNGSSGNAVTALQSALAELGYMDKKAVDGKFGSATEKALLTFQKRNGLKRDGVATPELQLLMYEGTPKDFRGYRQYVKTVAPVPNALIREGGTGDAVSRLQARLRYLGYYDGENTGVFDRETVAAYKMFEGRNGLNADGIADTEDQKVLYGANALSITADPTPTPAPTLVPPSRTLRRGDSGEDVKSMQTRLKELGYYTGTISGNFNSATENAVIAFQKKSSLTRDGILGPVTRSVLYAPYALYAQATEEPASTPAVSYEPITPDNVVLIRSGSTGSEVLRLQTRLQELGYYTSRLDGVYLTEDIEAVRAFQRANGLVVDGKAGYATQSCLYGDNPIAANRNTDESTRATLRYGSEGSEVTTLQNRLIALGYLSGRADGMYGKNTKAAVKAFQKNNNLNADGIAGTLTLEALYSANVQDNSVPTTTTLRIGTISDAVADMQNRLIALGYLNGKADGNFGTKTSLALIAFQRANGLTADGIAGAKTLKKLNDSNATAANGTSTGTTIPSAPNVSFVSASQVRYASWYNEVRAKVRQLPNATIYDFTTGISWKVNMFSFGAHADAEPITSADSANMLRAFGGKHTWTPKAVWVVLSDGTVYIGSLHNMEHGVQHNMNNNFGGHICIHFPRTQSQVQSIGPYATSHQKAIDLGWQATLLRVN
ncbi:MAG: peptidoglycan-binding protein [Clostridia bacterium]|nr:peptidoglycan-binding protein [Clostridia bacterium]